MKKRRELYMLYDSVDSVLKHYKNKINSIELDGYNIFINKTNETFLETLNSYYELYHELIQANKKEELDIYEKLACISIAIKENPFFILTDKYGFRHHTIINSNFAIDVALKFWLITSKDYKDIDLETLYNEYEELDYSKYLLSDILETKISNPLDISENFKLQTNLMSNILKKSNKNLTKMYH